MVMNLKYSRGSPVFDLAYSAFLLCIIAGYILWDRRLRRRRQQFRARRWRVVTGRFDEGDIITMKKGRSKNIAGYQVWLAYDYHADGDQIGIYTLPFADEFKSKEEAEEIRKLVAEQSISVRVSPRNSKDSCVLDEDIKPLVGGRI